MKCVIVIGAGAAGLVCAVKLAEGGCHVTVLEASDRLGGRIRTDYASQMPVELGAEFIHGRPPEFLSLLEELGLERDPLSGTNLSFSPAGDLHVESGEDSDDGPFGLIEQMVRWSEEDPGQDLSFSEYLQCEHISPEDAEGVIGYVEGFNAADVREVSVRSLAVQQKAEDSIDGDAVGHVHGGYVLLAEGLAARLQLAGGSLRTGAVVEEVAWKRGRVQTRVTSGEMFHADCAVMTLPLGVLQSGTVRFDPAPGEVLAQAARMRMGQVCRISLVFRRRWWAEIEHPKHEALQHLGFLLPGQRVPGAHFNVFWTGFPSLDPVLTAWVGGPSAAHFDAMDDHAIAHIACGDLARIFGLTQDQVLDEMVSYHGHDWQRDPLFLGAYSWVPAGAVDASVKMSVPVEDTLFFAGEHTDTTGHWGTVHGALRSGIRAAEQVMRAR